MHLHRVAFDHREVADSDARILLLDRHLEIAEHRERDGAQVALLERQRAAGHAGEFQQILNEHLHALGGTFHAFEVVEAFRPELLRAFGPQAPAKRLNLPQGFLQIVRRHRGEILQLRIALLELRGKAAQLLLVRFASGDIRSDADQPDRISAGIAQWHLRGL